MNNYFLQPTIPDCNIKPKLSRYRTIKQCLNEIKNLDSDTAISEWFIRQLCKNNEVIYRASGNKSLVNLDDLLRILGYMEGKSYVHKT